MTKLSWTGFSKKTPQERKEHLKTNALLSQENQDLLPIWTPTALV